MKTSVLVLAIVFAGLTQTSFASNQADTTVTIKVKGLTCSGDCKDISGSVKKIKGVRTCEAQGKPGALTAFKITYDPALVRREQLVKAVEATPGCEDPDSRPYKVPKK